MDYAKTPRSVIDRGQNSPGICHVKPGGVQFVVRGFSIPASNSITVINLQAVLDRMFVGFAFFQKAGYCILA